MSLRAEDTQIKQMSIELRWIKEVIAGVVWIFLIGWPYFTPGHSQSNWSKLDRQVKAIRYAGQSLTELTNQITQGAKSEKDKARALFTWTATHLYYDQLNDGPEANWENRQAIAIISRGKGVCWDYATVFQALCQRAGIPCLRITGYGPVRWPETQLPEQPNHAWNLFRVDGFWYLADATWQSGAPQGNDAFQIQTGKDYFGTPPELFVRNHLPEHPMFQLLDCPVSTDAFEKFKDTGVFHSPCSSPYAYQDTLIRYESMDEKQRSLWYQQEVYRFRPTPANRRYVDQVIADVGIALQTEGDAFFADQRFEQASVKYDESLSFFAKIQNQPSLFDWQQKAIGITWFNRGMACKKMEQTECNDFFENARSLLKPYESDPLLQPVINYLKQVLR